MTTIALKFSTVDTTKHVITGGHCYLVLSESTITVREMIAEKILAEFRKSRALDIGATSLVELVGTAVDAFSPMDEYVAIANVCHRMQSGALSLLVDGHAITDLDHVIQLTRRTGLSIMVNALEPQVAS